jgi:hypothetical protein
LNKVFDHAKELVHINQFKFEAAAFQKDFQYGPPRVKVPVWKVAQPLFKVA